MRRHSGGPRKLVGAGVAVLAAVGVVAATAPPAATAALIAGQANLGPQAAPSAKPPGGTLTAAGLFSALAKGAAGKIGGQFTGWALGAIGLGQSDPADLEEISGQLQAINVQLNNLLQTLRDIQDVIEAQSCDGALAAADEAVSAITTADDRYQGFIQAAVKDEKVSIPLMEDWANNALTGSNGIKEAMDSALVSIAKAMVGAGGTGILKSCLQDSIVPKPGAGTTNYFGTDVGYYGYTEASGQVTVNDFMGYYYGYQALGLMMLQEAYHLRALQAAGAHTGLPPQEVGDLCLNASDYPDAVAIACRSAEVVTNKVYQYLYAQFVKAGLPYTDDKVLLRNAGHDELFVRSLEDFTQTAGNNCPTPLTSANPCGVTTGTWATATRNIRVLYDGYFIWHTPDFDQVVAMISKRGSLTPGQYMDTIGFKNAEHKIILESQTATFSLAPSSRPDLHNRQMVCFFHSDLTGGQFCSEADVKTRLLQRTGQCNQYNYVNITQGTNSHLPPNNNNFFDAQTNCSTWVTQPGWLVGNTGSNAVQYRWPMLVTGDLACTNGRTHLNTEGVPTRCGADFDAMFTTFVARPASCAGTSVGVCAAQAQVTVTGPGVSGQWSTTAPVVGPEIDITYDGQAIHTITGTVEFPATDAETQAAVTFDVREAGHQGFYQGTVKRRSPGQPVLVAPLQHAQVYHHADGTVTSQFTWQRGHHGTYTLTWSILDNSS